MEQQFDVIIIGTGVAGLYAALQFDDDTNVLMLSKKELPLSNSSLAQGGVAAVFDKDNDNFRLHIADTIVAGKYKNNLSAVEKLVTQGPDDVRRLIDFGVDFDHTVTGKLSTTLEAGHSRNRIVHHKDSTGKAIIDALLKHATRRNNITILENAIAYDIEKVVNGFYVSFLINGQPDYARSNFCLIATGGIGRVYKYTTNSAIATGDGIALAHILGAKIKHLSRVQFHPTAFASKENRERFLISEAVRGEGAYLLNCNGERFAHNYDKRGELAPRDVVSHAIMMEMDKTGSDKFYLDITHKSPEFIKDRFPMIYSRCLDEGIDMTVDRIPVFPCQHYLMGGIDVNLDAQTSIKGLYAAGECTHTGVHGANRLASNSLLEGLVFARSAAEDIKRHFADEGKWIVAPRTQKPDISGKKQPAGIKTEVRNILQDVYFVNPKFDKIEAAYNRVDEIITDLVTQKYEITTNYVDTRSIAIVAGIILQEVKDGINL